MLFILNSVPEIMEQYRNLSQSKYIPIPEPSTITSSVQSALFFHYYKDYNAEGVRIRFALTFSEIDLRLKRVRLPCENCFRINLTL